MSWHGGGGGGDDDGSAEGEPQSSSTRRTRDRSMDTLFDTERSAAYGLPRVHAFRGWFKTNELKIS